jgi:hypothetical protein
MSNHSYIKYNIDSWICQYFLVLQFKKIDIGDGLIRDMKPFFAQKKKPQPVPALLRDQRPGETVDYFGQGCDLLYLIRPD